MERTESTKWVELIEVILTENGYYDNLRKYRETNNISLREMAKTLLSMYDYIDYASLYKFLDNMEHHCEDNFKKDLWAIRHEIQDYEWD